MSKAAYPSDKHMQDYLMPPYYPGKKIEGWRWDMAFPDGKKTMDGGMSPNDGIIGRTRKAYKVIDKRGAEHYIPGAEKEKK